MRKFLSYFPFFKKNRKDPLNPRTMEQSQLEDLEHQKSETTERKQFDEKSFEKATGEMPLRDSSATH